MEIENKFCAFIDILGFKNKTKNFENAVKYYKDYIRCYDLFTSIDKNIFADINGENKKQEEIEEIIFSDSIILYSADWLRLIQRVANVMAALLELGFWFRGGIGYGKYYGDISNSRISMVSEGLVEAVELEEKKAIYPRIILSSKVLTKMYDEARDLYQLAQLLIQCEDDFWCINPFFLIPDFTVMIKNINKEITSYSENQRICDKYIWIGELMNYFCIWSSMENQKEYYQKVEISKTEAKNLPCKILNNKKILDNLRDGIPYPYTLADAKAFIQSMSEAEPDSTYAFAITADGRLAGSIGAFRKENIHSRTAEIGYYIAEKDWGRGIGSDAVKRLCRYLFQNTDLLRIFAEPFAYNQASCRILEKAGFALEGVLRKNAVKNGKILDMKMYSIVRE